MSNLLLKTSEASTSGLSDIAILVFFAFVAGLYFIGKRREHSMSKR